MPSKLYVSNLSQSATLASVRQLFSACGEVIEVEYAVERGSRSPRSAAYVTMATSAGAEKAVTDLHGRMHLDRVLMLNRMSHDTGPTPEPQTSGGRRPKVDPAKVLITQQYRDRLGFTYDLSCSEKVLTLRFIFPVDDCNDWKIEARLGPSSTSPATASAITREQALKALIDTCDASWADSGLDWVGVTGALRAVKAL